MLRIILLVTLGMTACQSDETISGYMHENAIWYLKDLDGQTPQTEITLTFPSQGKIIGRAPCNRYFATQTQPLPWFNAEPIASTKMACPHLDEEYKYFTTLANATQAEVSDTTLILSNDTGPILTYIRQ